MEKKGNGIIELADCEKIERMLVKDFSRDLRISEEYHARAKMDRSKREREVAKNTYDAKFPLL